MARPFSGKESAVERLTIPRKKTGRRHRLGEPKAIPYAARIGVRVSDTQDLIQKVEQGFSYQAFERVRRLLGMPASELAALLQIPQRTLTRRKQAGKLAADESERLLRLSRVVDTAIELFEGEPQPAVEWLQSSNRALGGQVPLEMAKTEIGAREVEDLIGRLEHGIPS
ncbi:MAG: antitoxin Xre/MbcA/ParS toxin-binding domain-containing protein [Chloroflexota bacterium]